MAKQRAISPWAAVREKLATFLADGQGVLTDEEIVARLQALAAKVRSRKESMATEERQADQASPAGPQSQEWMQRLRSLVGRVQAGQDARRMADGDGVLDRPADPLQAPPQAPATELRNGRLEERPPTSRGPGSSIGPGSP